jgi:hypothetical protein
VADGADEFVEAIGGEDDRRKRRFAFAREALGVQAFAENRLDQLKAEALSIGLSKTRTIGPDAATSRAQDGAADAIPALRFGLQVVADGAAVGGRSPGR